MPLPRATNGERGELARAVPPQTRPSKRPRGPELRDDKTPPVCHHLVPAALRTVRKEGPNRGRLFYSCCHRHWKDPNNCGFFAWEDEHDPETYEPPRAEPVEPVVEGGIDEEAFLRRYEGFTDADRQRIRDAPQRTPDWYAARRHRITASNFGAAANHHKLSPRHELVRAMLWKHTFTGNEMTAWGTDKEPVACDWYEKRGQERVGKDNFWVEDTGLNVDVQRPWLAVSPDGLVHERDPETGERVDYLLEIKCPWSLKDRKKGDGDFYPVVDLPNGVSGPIPHYYYDQIQGVMGVLGLPYADFLVWTPEEAQVTRFPFDRKYWEEELFPALREFFFEHYVPAAVDLLNGRLMPGDVTPG